MTFPEPPAWEVFLDPRFTSQMTLLEEIRDAFAAGLFSLGLDPNTTAAGEIDRAADRLIEMKGVIRAFDSATYIDGLALGELVAAEAYSSDFLQARELNAELAFTIPDEGGLRWVDSMAVPADAPHDGNGERFMNFYLEPDVAAEVANSVGVDTGNAAAAELLDSSLLDDPVIFPPPDVLTRVSFTADLGDEVEGLYREAWGRVQSA